MNSCSTRNRWLPVLVALSVLISACWSLEQKQRFHYLRKVSVHAKADIDTLHSILANTDRHNQIFPVTNTTEPCLSSKDSVDVYCESIEETPADNSIVEAASYLLGQHPEWNLSIKSNASLASAGQQHGVFWLALLLVILIVFLIIFLFASIGSQGDSCAGCLLILIITLIGTLIAILT